LRGNGKAKKIMLTILAIACAFIVILVGMEITFHWKELKKTVKISWGIVTACSLAVLCAIIGHAIGAEHYLGTNDAVLAVAGCIIDIALLYGGGRMLGKALRSKDNSGTHKATVLCSILIIILGMAFVAGTAAVIH
jgi:hypothetical protein